MLLVLSPAPAQQQPPPNAPEFGGSSPIALVVILCLFIVTFLLVASMNKHLKKVPRSFEPVESFEPAEGETDSSDGDPGARPDDDPDSNTDSDTDRGAGNGPKTATPQ